MWHRPDQYRVTGVSSASSLLSQFSRTAALVVMCISLAGCPVMYKGLIRNDTPHDVALVNAWAPEKLPIAPGDASKEPVFVWDCVQVEDGTGVRYFNVPYEFEVPDDAFDPKFFSVHIAMAFTEDGLFFESPSQGLIALNEVDTCGEAWPTE